MTLASDSWKTVAQALAIVGLAVIIGMILHKGVGDIALIAQEHSGWEFWKAVLRYFIGNLAGGGKLPQAPGS